MVSNDVLWVSTCSPAHALAVCALICLECCRGRWVRRPGTGCGDKTAPAAPAGGDKAAADKAAAEKGGAASLPPDAHVQQSMEMAQDAALHGDVGALPGARRLRRQDRPGKVVGNAYTMDGENRPVTFAMNGGPGASSVYLNFGRHWPKI